MLAFVITGAVTGLVPLAPTASVPLNVAAGTEATVVASDLYPSAQSFNFAPVATQSVFESNVIKVASTTGLFASVP